jgi:N-acetylglucosaminyldiphosphoundecaprenol N-acetyl-beta-D-mannosaminyltransferase
VLGARIDAIDWETAINRVIDWGGQRASRYICICNVHSVVTAANEGSFMQVINEADMATPDGMPVAWMLRHLGHPGQQRISGPDLMWRYLEAAAARGHVVSFYGSSEETLGRLRRAMLDKWPTLRVGVMVSPPYRQLSREEEKNYVDRINQAQTAVLFVSLGCPKQERWMHAQRGAVQAVMIGVGAAFDYHAGVIRRAPLWMQRHGLEWAHRLASEPRRLWKRYLVTNTAFVLRAARQLLGARTGPN